MNHNSYPACALADYLLKKVQRPAGETINLMKLNALLYYCEAWSLAIFDRELLAEELQAWDHGPVFPSVWEKLKHKAWNDLDADDLNAAAGLDDETTSLLDDVFRAYGEYSTPELENMIKKDAPWKEARRGLPVWDLTKRPINKATMTHFYKIALEADQAAATRPARSATL